MPTTDNEICICIIADRNTRNRALINSVKVVEGKIADDVGTGGSCEENEKKAAGKENIC